MSTHIEGRPAVVRVQVNRLARIVGVGVTLFAFGAAIAMAAYVAGQQSRPTDAAIDAQRRAAVHLAVVKAVEAKGAADKVLRLRIMARHAAAQKAADQRLLTRGGRARAARRGPPGGVGLRPRAARSASSSRPVARAHASASSASSAITRDSWPPCQASGDLPSSSTTRRGARDRRRVGLPHRQRVAGVGLVAVGDDDGRRRDRGQVRDALERA